MKSSSSTEKCLGSTENGKRWSNLTNIKTRNIPFCYKMNSNNCNQTWRSNKFHLKVTLGTNFFIPSLNINYNDIEKMVTFYLDWDNKYMAGSGDTSPRVVVGNAD